MRLLAHSPLLPIALVQHDDDRDAYLYCFGQRHLSHPFQRYTTYERIDNPETWFVPRSWITDFDDTEFPTAEEVGQYVLGYLAGKGVSPHV
ncbi:hypothetical protein [Mycolicibacterium phage Kashi_SSH1]|nr:hypothetical protein [Mycolicibacterium phage Kashi_SSH1]